jgi:hypothetical protein
MLFIPVYRTWFCKSRHLCTCDCLDWTTCMQLCVRSYLEGWMDYQIRSCYFPRLLYWLIQISCINSIFPLSESWCLIWLDFIKFDRIHLAVSEFLCPLSCSCIFRNRLRCFIAFPGVWEPPVQTTYCFSAYHFYDPKGANCHIAQRKNGISINKRIML